MAVYVCLNKGERVQCDWVAGTVLYLHFSLRLKVILITLPQYRFSSLTFYSPFLAGSQITLSSSSGYCTSLHYPHKFSALPRSLVLIHFFYYFYFLSDMLHYYNSEGERGENDVVGDSMKPTNHSPAQILCLPEEQSSHSWQPASLFTYPVCRHTIAMTTS